MKTSQIMNAVSRKFHGLGFTVKKHSPEILLATGIVSGVTAAVMACKATTKLSTILDKAKDEVAEIHHYETHPELLVEEYTPEKAKRDVAVVYAHTGVELVKLYAPAVALGTLSIVSVLTSHNILRKRNVALAAAYAAVDSSFKGYRNRVIERFGEELDRELKYGIKAKEVEETVVDENGEVKTVKKTVEVSEGDVYSPYARIFDETCLNWVKDAEQNMYFLRRVQEHANRELKRKGILFLNEVYEMLGFKRSIAGQQVGWIYDPNNPDHVGDNAVDFGIYDFYTGNEKVDEPKRAFINGLERSIVLDFNVDGPVYNKLEA